MVMGLTQREAEWETKTDREREKGRVVGKEKMKYTYIRMMLCCRWVMSRRTVYHNNKKYNFTSYLSGNLTHHQMYAQHIFVCSHFFFVISFKSLIHKMNGREHGNKTNNCVEKVLNFIRSEMNIRCSIWDISNGNGSIFDWNIFVVLIFEYKKFWWIFNTSSSTSNYYGSFYCG